MVFFKKRKQQVVEPPIDLKALGGVGPDERREKSPLGRSNKSWLSRRSSTTP